MFHLISLMNKFWKHHRDKCHCWHDHSCKPSNLRQNFKNVCCSPVYIISLLRQKHLKNYNRFIIFDHIPIFFNLLIPPKLLNIDKIHRSLQITKYLNPMWVIYCDLINAIIHRVQLNIRIVTVIICQDIPINLVNYLFDGKILAI